MIPLCEFHPSLNVLPLSSSTIPQDWMANHVNDFCRNNKRHLILKERNNLIDIDLYGNIKKKHVEQKGLTPNPKCQPKRDN